MLKIKELTISIHEPSFQYLSAHAHTRQLKDITVGLTHITELHQAKFSQLGDA